MAGNLDLEIVFTLSTITQVYGQFLILPLVVCCFHYDLDYGCATINCLAVLKFLSRRQKC